jgi:hypothetical protein
MNKWSKREEHELTALLRKLDTIHRKAVMLTEAFGRNHWPEAIASPLIHLEAAASAAINAVYSER